MQAVESSCTSLVRGLFGWRVWMGLARSRTWVCPLERRWMVMNRQTNVEMGSRK